MEAPDKSKDKVQAMFDEIAPTYDKLNHLFTLNIDINWRRDIIKYLKENKVITKIILDLASGTGDLTRELLELNPERIFSVDISTKMLEVLTAKLNDKRLTVVLADAKNLPFENNYFDLITIGFGIRNFEELERSLQEIHRVIKSGGHFVVLEMFKSKGVLRKIFDVYFGKVMPILGNKISRSKSAYNYLFNSVNNFYNVNEFIRICEKNGFQVNYLKNNFLAFVNTVYMVKSKN